MEVLVCLEPGQLALEQRPEPERGASEVLVRVCRVGVCGTDYHIYEGTQPFLKYPRIMGHELAVEVAEAPTGSAFKTGDLAIVNPYLSCGTCHACQKGKPNCCTRIAVLGVHRDGGMTEYISVPESNLYPAVGLNADEAAAVEFLAIGAHGIGRAGMTAAGKTLIVGAGPIGIGAAIFAGLEGAAVTLMDRDGDRLVAAAELTGAVATMVAGDRNSEAVSDATGGDGFDTVIDATGSRASMEASFAYVAHGGAYVLLGLVRDSVTFSDPEFHKREMRLLASRNALKSDFERVMAAIAAKKVPISRLITHRSTLVGAASDIARWATDKRGLIKAMIEVS